jgi:hypothetical protein
VNRNELFTKLHTRALDQISEILISLQDATDMVGEIPAVHDDWDHDDGPVLWWNTKDTGGEIADQPEYIGAPDDSGWPWDWEDRPYLLWVKLPKLARRKP